MASSTGFINIGNSTSASPMVLFDATATGTDQPCAAYKIFAPGAMLIQANVGGLHATGDPGAVWATGEQEFHCSPQGCEPNGITKVTVWIAAGQNGASNGVNIAGWVSERR